MRSMLYVLGIAVLVASVQANLFAGITQVPEIDGGTLVSGLGLLSGGFMILRARYGRR